MNLACLGTLARKQVQSGWLSGYSYRKSFTYSRASGAVSNYQVKMVIGESGGINLLSNSGFDSNTTGWTAIYSTIASVSGGQSGNCLQITRTSGDFQQAYQNVTLAKGCRYLLTAYVKSGTSGNEKADLVATIDDSSWSWYFLDTVTSSGEWQQLSVEFTATSGNARAVLHKDTATTGTMLFDTVVLQPAIHCNSHCLSTFNDLRFTASDGTTELDYWIESISGTTPNQIATVWVELDSVGTGNTTYYMYYGKADASAASSIANTFIIGDDFERGSNEDAVGGSWSVIAGSAIISTEQVYAGTRSCKLVGGATVAEISIPLEAASGTYAKRIRVYKEDAADVTVFRHGDGSKRIVIGQLNDEGFDYWNGSEFVSLGVSGAKDAWYLVELANIDFSAGTADLYYNDALLKADCPMQDPSTAAEDVATLRGDGNSGRDSWIDNFLVRNWRSVEPALGSWGSEESA